MQGSRAPRRKIGGSRAPLLHSRVPISQKRHFCSGSKSREALGSGFHNKNFRAPGFQGSNHPPPPSHFGALTFSIRCSWTHVYNTQMYVRFVSLQFSIGNTLILFVSYTCIILIRWFLRLAWQVSQVASHFSSDEMNCNRFWNQHGLTCWHLLLAFWLYLTRITLPSKRFRMAFRRFEAFFASWTGKNWGVRNKVWEEGGEGRKGNTCPQTPRFWKTRSSTNRVSWLAQHGSVDCQVINPSIKSGMFNWVWPAWTQRTGSRSGNSSHYQYFYLKFL